ncbi:MAG: Na(+)-translocating NADH-quinone reductase subunit A [Prolixibacteraceae bacterium]|nr:Na(+)-translocating NADH-quinone reductase subunit A [Prolixibacteraceae bacterium]
MSKTIRIRKGLDIKIKGKAEQVLGPDVNARFFGVKPTDFPGLIPKLSVNEGAIVKVGSPLFYHKNNPEVVFPSPASGIVTSVIRGERRKILEVGIESDGKFTSESFSSEEMNAPDRETVQKTLLKSGLWPFIIQRPFGIIARPGDVPNHIFIQGFDSSPLAPDYDFTLKDEHEAIQRGIDILTKLTDGKVHLGLRPGSILSSLKNVEINYFAGPHPAGNVGIQIHKVRPINKGDLIWTLNIQSVVFIGRLFLTGKLNFKKIIALAGSEVKEPGYVTVTGGISVSSIVEGKTLKEKNERIISGNVLTGSKVEPGSYLGFYDNLITVIPEGNEIELFGWATPGLKKHSASNTFFAQLFPKKEYTLNANYHGGERPFVVSGQYEKLLPMDILPVYLLKAIIANDIDKMEQLGIYEIIEEDLALCEYACTSKIEVQDLIRKGINSLIKELV